MAGMFEFLSGKKEKAKRRILIADDDEHVRDLVSDVLGTQDYDVEGVVDGHEAIERLKAGKFDLVILDVHMPKVEGPQVLETLRLMPGGRDQGVIMLSSESSMETFTHVCEQNVFTYLPKPFSPTKLVETVRAYFDKNTTGSV